MGPHSLLVGTQRSAVCSRAARPIKQICIQGTCGQPAPVVEPDTWITNGLKFEAVHIWDHAGRSAPTRSRSSHRIANSPTFLVWLGLPFDSIWRRLPHRYRSPGLPQNDKKDTKDKKGAKDKKDTKDKKDKKDKKQARVLVSGINKKQRKTKKHTERIFRVISGFYWFLLVCMGSRFF